MRISRLKLFVGKVKQSRATTRKDRKQKLADAKRKRQARKLGLSSNAGWPDILRRMHFIDRRRFSREFGLPETVNFDDIHR